MQLCIDYLFIYFVGMIINKNYVITTGAPLNHPPTTVHGQYSALHAVDRLRLLRLPPWIRLSRRYSEHTLEIHYNISLLIGTWYL